jgi:two-component system, OmpR family, sensor histidine kinase KdpD
VVYVQQPNLSPANKVRVRRFLDEAAAAGAEVHMLTGSDAVATILDYARKKKITQIYVGHSGRGRWYERFLGGPLHRLLRSADQMDVRIFPQ